MFVRRGGEKKKTKARRGGSREDPAALSFAVRCHREFENPSHLQGAKRIPEGVDGEAKSLIQADWKCKLAVRITSKAKSFTN